MGGMFGVFVGVGVTVPVGVRLGVEVAVGVGVRLAEGMRVKVLEDVWVAVGAPVTDALGDGGGVGSLVLVVLGVSVGEVVGCGCPALPPRAGVEDVLDLLLCERAAEDLQLVDGDVLVEDARLGANFKNQEVGQRPQARWVADLLTLLHTVDVQTDIESVSSHVSGERRRHMVPLVDGQGRDAAHSAHVGAVTPRELEAMVAGRSR
jgi:hypothetical protein